MSKQERNQAPGRCLIMSKVFVSSAYSFVTIPLLTLLCVSNFNIHIDHVIYHISTVGLSSIFGSIITSEVVLLTEERQRRLERNQDGH